MNPEERDRQIRLAAFRWLDEQRALHGDGLPRQLLERGFEFDGIRVPLLGPQGIFKPQVLPDMPLSITTIPGSKYSDDLRDGNAVIEYKYRGENAQHHDNVGLRLAWKRQVPLAYFYRVMPGLYLATYPAFVVNDRPASLSFEIQIDDELRLDAFERSALNHDPGADAPRREYVTVVTKRRLHQQAFRERVLRAYREHCALCRLRHAPLLDAAHIIPDNEEDGLPEVPNGLALCKIHHAAYDQNFLSIRPDYSVQIRQSLLDEHDGPMLQHGLKDMHETRIFLPPNRKNYPNPDFLERRHGQFLEVEGSRREKLTP